MGALQGPPLSFAGGVSDVHTTPFPHALGTRARDASGNEYVYVDYTSSASPEQIVTISPTFTASLMTVGDVGPMGVVPDFGKIGQSVETPTAPTSYQWTSDNAGWVQIYGRAYIGIGANVVSPSDAANGPTSVRTSAAISFSVPTTVTTPLGTPLLVSQALPAIAATTRINIEGMYVATDASLGTVSGLTGSTDATASNHAIGRVAVWLNYPQGVPAAYTS